eukprot:TRINITY_DN45284_c0_g1_i1.p1 TRINITY_DN45284_c0_g1~~TRINITY_DN45284_c0_g1_i1.p1  ORF type:complete len:322 (+),score=67.36 TRINITY_DN45284_c0_g1_i1:142-966(+)
MPAAVQKELSSSSPPTHPAAKKFIKSLSLVPEEATVTARLDFVIIGTKAREVVSAMYKADACVDLSKMVGHTEAHLIAEEGQATSRGRAAYFLLDEDRVTVARVRLETIADFQDAIPAIDDRVGIRNTCFVFLLDTRLSVVEDDEDASHLSRAFAEMMFVYNNAKQRLRKQVALETTVVVHDAADEEMDKLRDEPRVDALACRLEGATKAKHVKTVNVMNFESPASIYACMGRIASEMALPCTYGVHMSSLVTRGSWLYSADAPERRTTCCVVQ